MKVRNYILAVGLVLSVIAIAPATAEMQLEVNLGVNLFDIVGTTNAVEIDISGTGAPGDTLLTGDMESTIPASALFGVYAGYAINPNMSIGGEFGFFKNEAEGKLTLVESDDWYVYIDAGKADIQILRIGPVFRYYFLTDKLRPFVHVGAAYTSLTIDIEDLTEKLKEGLVDISAGGGVFYLVSPMIYLGGYARADYYLNIKKSEIEDVYSSGDVLSTKTKWLPVSLIFQVGFLF